MKKFSALAGALLLSSSLLAGCTPNAAQDNNANNRTGTYNTDRAGRIMDNNNGVGVRNTRVDQDRLGVRDNIGPDRRPNVLTNDAPDRDRLGVRDRIGPDTANYRNMRADRSLEARVEAIPGIRDAKVLVNGNTAYVGINQGTNLGGGNRAGIRSDVPPTAGHQANTTNRAGNVSQYGGTMSDRDYGTSGLTPTSPLTPQTGTYGTRDNRGGLFGTGIGTGMGTYGTGRGYGTGTYGTGTGTGMGTYSNGNYGNGGVTGTDGTRGTTRNGAGLFGTSGNNRVGTYTNNTGTTNNTRTNNVGTYNTNNNADVSNDIKQRVISAVKQGNPSITTVYVSANPGLYNRMDAFSRDTVSGHPGRGLNDLGDMFRRLFPTTGTAGIGAGTSGTNGTTGGTTTGRTMGNTGGTTSGVTNR
ncbi:hypothetical protein CBW65_00005 [Tumebacillus avium]|uniref:Sporulation protein n=1 Tax=Tumebacillus avium TaxID=1903704 RepID=A0A1Y0IWL0_9BACL|nr:YhcN/YlaJ family sporulation lipoprotein [Tumebacillus avium]ARU63734.1 hypothetical protein CBW65_00005 [Tumebacillus avium]